MTAQNEMTIARVRRQKDIIDELVRQLEEKPRLCVEDKQYLDIVLKDIEGSLKEIRKNLR